MMDRHNTQQEDDQHSGRTRVSPVFRWLREHGDKDWVTELVRLADGIQMPDSVGAVVTLAVGKERIVEPSPARLAWMVRNAEKLAPADGRQWREYRRRVIDNPRKEEALRRLDAGLADGIRKELKLEGGTHADCLIECERAFVWVEGKRNDWLSPSTRWDVTRDQLARNLEALWLVASESKKDFWLLICHEHDLKHHEQELVTGYRAGTWKAGFPHLTPDVRAIFQRKIGTVRWKTIVDHWLGLAASFHEHQPR
jgi:hypothetical protein